MARTASGTLARVESALLALLLLACDPALPPQPTPSEYELGLWVWSNLPATDAAAAAALIELARDTSVTSLYMQAQTLVYDAPDALQQLVVRAAAANVQVELLIGRPEWARADQAGEPIQLVGDLVAFIAKAKGPRAVALQLNIEPHGLPEWSAARAQLLLDLLDLLDKLQPIAHKAGIALHFDMPTWYDSIAVTRLGQTRPMSEWVIDAVDTAVLMDYDDDLPDLLDRISSELAYADKVHKRLIVGVETQCGLDNDLTFCEEGRTALRATLAQLHAALKLHPAYAGQAIHHWKSLAELPK
ncbi:MAG: hypothetical protein HY902_01780 [Deltaproteobacteria bacterium]|nr:hypothetical protein [Deltaproteobacteria bacterium]